MAKNIWEETGYTSPQQPKNDIWAESGYISPEEQVKHDEALSQIKNEQAKAENALEFGSIVKGTAKEIGERAKTTLGGAAHAIGAFPTYAKQVAANAIEGGKPYDDTDSFLDRWRQEGNAQAKADAADPSSQKPGLFNVVGETGQTWNTVAQSLPYSALVDVPVYAGALLTPTTGGASVIGGKAAQAAGAATMFQASKGQYVSDTLDKFIEKHKETNNGQEPTREQILAEQERLQPFANEYAAYEVGMEFAGSKLGAKALGIAKNIPASSAAGQFLATKTGKAVGFIGSQAVTELPSETETQLGQHNVDVKAGYEGKNDDKLREWTSLDDQAKSFNEVKDAVLAQSLLMGGGIHLGSMAKALIASPTVTPTPETVSPQLTPEQLAEQQAQVRAERETQHTTQQTEWSPPSESSVINVGGQYRTVAEHNADATQTEPAEVVLAAQQPAHTVSVPELPEITHANDLYNTLVNPPEQLGIAPLAPEQAKNVVKTQIAENQKPVADRKAVPLPVGASADVANYAVQNTKGLTAQASAQATQQHFDTLKEQHDNLILSQGFETNPELQKQAKTIEAQLKNLPKISDTQTQIARDAARLQSESQAKLAQQGKQIEGAFDTYSQAAAVIPKGNHAYSIEYDGQKFVVVKPVSQQQVVTEPVKDEAPLATPEIEDLINHQANRGDINSATAIAEARSTKGVSVSSLYSNKDTLKEAQDGVDKLNKYRKPESVTYEVVKSSSGKYHVIKKDTAIPEQVALKQKAESDKKQSEQQAKVEADRLQAEKLQSAKAKFTEEATKYIEDAEEYFNHLKSITIENIRIPDETIKSYAAYLDEILENADKGNYTLKDLQSQLKGYKLSILNAIFPKGAKRRINDTWDFKAIDTSSLRIEVVSENAIPPVLSFLDVKSVIKLSSESIKETKVDTKQDKRLLLNVIADINGIDSDLFKELTDGADIKNLQAKATFARSATKNRKPLINDLGIQTSEQLLSRLIEEGLYFNDFEQLKEWFVKELNDKNNAFYGDDSTIDSLIQDGKDRYNADTETPQISDTFTDEGGNVANYTTAFDDNELQNEVTTETPIIETPEQDAKEKTQEDLDREFIASLPQNETLSIDDVKALWLKSSSKYINMLLDLIYPIAKKLGIKVKFAKVPESEKNMVTGDVSYIYYDHISGTVVMDVLGWYSEKTVSTNKNTFLKSNRTAIFKDTFMHALTHELLHSITANAYLETQGTKFKSGITKLNFTQIQALKSIQKIYDFLNENYQGSEFLGGKEYGLANILELMAEMSNEEFVNKLQTIKLPSDLRYSSKLTNVFDSIVGFIRDFLTGNKKQDLNAADSLFSAISDLITSPQDYGFNNVQIANQAETPAETQAVEIPQLNNQEGTQSAFDRLTDKEKQLLVSSRIFVPAIRKDGRTAFVLNNALAGIITDENIGNLMQAVKQYGVAEGNTTRDTFRGLGYSETHVAAMDILFNAMGEQAKTRVFNEYAIKTAIKRLSATVGKEGGISLSDYEDLFTDSPVRNLANEAHIKALEQEALSRGYGSYKEEKLDWLEVQAQPLNPERNSLKALAIENVNALDTVEQLRAAIKQSREKIGVVEKTVNRLKQIFYRIFNSKKDGAYRDLKQPIKFVSSDRTVMFIVKKAPQSFVFSDNSSFDSLEIQAQIAELKQADTKPSAKVSGKAERDNESKAIKFRFNPEILGSNALLKAHNASVGLKPVFKGFETFDKSILSSLVDLGELKLYLQNELGKKGLSEGERNNLASQLRSADSDFTDLLDIISKTSYGQPVTAEMAKYWDRYDLRVKGLLEQSQQKPDNQPDGETAAVETEKPFTPPALQTPESEVGKTYPDQATKEGYGFDAGEVKDKELGNPYASNEERESAIDRLLNQAKDSEYYEVAGIRRDEIEDAAKHGASEQEISNAIDKGADAFYDLSNKYYEKSGGKVFGFGERSIAEAVRTERRELTPEEELALKINTAEGISSLTGSQFTEIMKLAGIKKPSAKAIQSTGYTEKEIYFIRFFELASGDRYKLIKSWIDAGALNQSETEQSAAKSPADYLADIAQNSTNPLYRALSTRLLEDGVLPSNLTITEVDSLTAKSGKGNQVQGKYNAADNSVQINNHADVANLDREKAILHELVHAATINRLAKNKPAAVVLSAIRLKLEKHPLGKAFGKMDNKELIANALTDADIQNALKQIEYQNGTLWTRFVSAIANIVGVEKGQENALSALLVVSDELLGESQPTPAQPQAQSAEQPTTYQTQNVEQSKNTIFTDDMAEAARQRIKSRLGRLNAGVDPEMFADGIVLAGYHIEKGARSFAAYAKAMVADMGEEIKPYLKQFYYGVKADPRAESFASEMDKLGLVEDADIEELLAEPKAETQALKQAIVDKSGINPDKLIVTSVGREQPKLKQVILNGFNASAFAEKLLNGESFKTIVQARKALSDTPIKAGTIEAKQADEAIELASVIAARQIVAKGLNHQETFDALSALAEQLPSLNVRTSTSIAEQAYSTPLALAYVASVRAGITEQTTVTEPTAGNGALLIAANPDNAIVNELNQDRVKALESQGFTVSNDNAVTFDFGKQNSDVVIANPPFGVVKDENGVSQTFTIAPKYQTNEIDHAIVFNALKAMKQDGKAVLIVGGVMTNLSDAAREDKYNGKAKRSFYYTLYNEYNVVDHFTVSGDLYAKQGASYPVDVIVIEGKGKSVLTYPAASLPRIIDTVEELKNELENNKEVVQTTEGVTGKTTSKRTERDNVDNGTADSRTRDTNTINNQRESDRVLPEPNGVTESVSGRNNTTDKLADNAVSEPNGVSDSISAKPVESARIENKFQAEYSPASEVKAIGTLVPVNMQSAIKSALATLSDKYGSVDGFVATQLGYELSDIGKYFSAEQVDAIALSLDNIINNKGFIIGDQTGVGKGRVNAAMIRYAILNNITPIFVTEKPNLYGDMIRDLNDIGMESIKPFATNAAFEIPINDAAQEWYSESERAKEEGLNPPKKPDDAVFIKTPSNAVHAKEMARMQYEGKLTGYDAIFTTYSQMQTIKGEQTARMDFLGELAKGALVILDESHNAGGVSVAPRRGAANGGSGATVEGGTKAGRAGFTRYLVQLAKGVFYSSATYAKRPDVLDLYSKTDMGLISNPQELANSLNAGGVPLQQAVASMLAKAGQYIRREKSFDGIVYDTVFVDVDRQFAERASEIMRGIMEFDVLKSAAIKSLDKELKASARKLSHDRSTGGAGASTTNFTSVMHNMIGQMLLMLKVQPAINEALAALGRGEKPVITLSNTMGSAIDEYADEAGLNVGDAIGLNFGDLLARYLSKSRRVIEGDPFGKKESRYLTDEELGFFAKDHYDKLMDKIESYGFDKYAISPIDAIHNALHKKGYRTGEITGRNSIIDYFGDTPIFKKRPAQQKTPAGKRKTINDFNNGMIDVIILNQSGATGLSLHASPKVGSDTRKRHMIIAQPELNIDTHMQMLGRVNRTGQIILPSYGQLTANIPAEKRPSSILAKKMAMLNANTTAGKESAVKAKDVPDFMNDYGDEVAAAIMHDNRDIHNLLGKPLKENEKTGFDIDGAMRKVTGRIPVLSLADQEKLYGLLEDAYDEYIDMLNKTGQNQLEAKAMPLDAKIISTTEAVKPLSNSDSPFAEGVNAETVDVKRLGKPYTQEQILQLLTDKTGIKDGATLTKWRNEQLAKIKTAYDARMADINAMSTEDETDIKQKRGAIDNLDAWSGKAIKFINEFSPSKPVILFSPQGGQYIGYVGSIERKGDAKNYFAMGNWKITVYVADAAKQFVLPLSKVVPNEIVEGKWTIEITKEDVKKALEEGMSESRETRVILTGNMLSAYAFDKTGQIINYTTHEDETKQGILMPKKFDLQKALDDSPVIFKTADVAKTYLEQSQGVDTDTAYGVRSSDNSLRIMPQKGYYVIYAPASKAKGGQYYLNPRLIDVVEDREFIKRGNEMVATINKDNMANALQVIFPIAGALQPVSKDKGKVFLESKPQFSKSPDPQNSHTVISLNAAFTKQLDGKFGSGWTSRLFATNKFEIQTLAQANDNYPELNLDGVQGFYDPKTDKTIFIAENIEQDKNLVGLAMHEIGTHALELGKSSAEFQALIENLAKSAFRPAVRDAIDTALKSFGLKAIPKAGQSIEGVSRDDVLHEVAAYLVEKNPSLSVVQKIIQWFRNAIRALGKSLPIMQRVQWFRDVAAINEADIIQMATNALRSAPESLLFDSVGRNQEAVKTSYAGQLAANADKSALARAVEMEQQGIDNETIRKETGWFLGMDDKWRFEIPDEDVTFYPAVEGWLKKFNGSKEWAAKLPDVLEHDSLFQQYPFLKDITVFSDTGKTETRGSFSSDNKAITLNATQSYLKQLSTLLHEIQHAIQGIEGFARGGTPEMFRDEYNRNMDERRWYQNEVNGLWWREQIENLASQKGIDLYKNDDGSLANEDGSSSLKKLRLLAVELANSYKEDDMEELLPSKEEEEVAFSASFDKGREYRKTIEAKRSWLLSEKIISPDVSYARLAGEIEARDTQARIGMTAAERKESTPYVSQGISKEDAIVRFGSGVAESQQPNTLQVFKDLDSRTPANIRNKALQDVLSNPNADRIMYINDNIIDILSKLENVNGFVIDCR
jgi:hypothetical protein